MTEILIEAMRS